MKNVIFIIVGILFMCLGGAVLFMDLYFNGPNQSFMALSSQIKNGINPTWALLMIFSILGIIGGLVMLTKGIEGREKAKTLKK